MPLTPICPTMRGRLTDPEYYNKNGWTFKGAMKAENKERKEVDFVLDEFKNNCHFDKDTIKRVNKKLPENFDVVYDYFKELVFRNKNYDPKQKIWGKLWMRELFM